MRIIMLSCAVNDRRHRFPLSVPILSRSALTYILAPSGVLKDSAISIFGLGGSRSIFDLSDIELASTKGRSRISRIVATAGRYILITDAAIKYLQAQYPSSTGFSHVFPGLVQINVLMYADMPHGLKYLATYTIDPIAARTFSNTAANYAEIPVSLAANRRRITWWRSRASFGSRRIWWSRLVCTFRIKRIRRLCLS